jgi:hypothetical protein
MQTNYNPKNDYRETLKDIVASSENFDIRQSSQFPTIGIKNTMDISENDLGYMSNPPAMRTAYGTGANFVQPVLSAHIK